VTTLKEFEEALRELGMHMALAIPAGAAAEVVVYTNHWTAFALIRRILLRMWSWQNYVFL